MIQSKVEVKRICKWKLLSVCGCSQKMNAVCVSRMGEDSGFQMSKLSSDCGMKTAHCKRYLAVSVSVSVCCLANTHL